MTVSDHQAHSSTLDSCIKPPAEQGPVKGNSVIGEQPLYTVKKFHKLTQKSVLYSEG